MVKFQLPKIHTLVQWLNFFSQGILNYHFYSYDFSIDLFPVQISFQATYR